MLRLVLLALIVSAPAVAAQTTFSVRAGVSALEARFANDERFNSPTLAKDARLGLTTGVLAAIPVSSVFSLRPGVNYSQKGYRVSSNAAGLGGSSTLGADYLEVPLLAGLRVSRSQTFDATLELGPVLGYRVRTVQDCSGEFEAECEGFDYSDDLRDVEVGGVFGFALGSGPFGVDVRYVTSLARVDKEDVLDFGDVEFSGLSASARLTFGR